MKYICLILGTIFFCVGSFFAITFADFFVSNHNIGDLLLSIACAAMAVYLMHEGWLEYSRINDEYE